MPKGLVIGCSLGNCVHVAGAVHFLSFAADEGYDTLFLGPAVSVRELMDSVERNQPKIVTVGYRLTPDNAVPLINELRESAKALSVKPMWVFGGTRPVAEKAREADFFDVIFDGTDDIDDSITLLRTGVLPESGGAESYSQELTARIAQKRPYPLLRHHFGLPSYKETLEGCQKIAEARVLDVISLGIDQNTQQFYFEPEKRDPKMDGAGGVPVKNDDEFAALKRASECGNYPLMRCYSGTADVFKLAEVLRRTIHNAWCAVPLCWYNELDGRGSRPLRRSVEEAQQLMHWHGERGVPVEANEPHHWGLRDAHDVISVAMSYISAYNARKYGVHDYVSQYMFNIPNSLSFSMDLAKVMAQCEMTESLSAHDFRIYREVRAGLPFLSGDLNVAKGQLAASTMLAMNIDPHIIHVVGYSEAERAATPEIVVESCKIVRGVVRSVLSGGADAKFDPLVISRRDELKAEAEYLLDFIRNEYSAISDDPLGDAAVLTDCIKRGILDAPHIVKKNGFKGELQTRIVGGKCVAWNAASKSAMTERERLARLAGV